MPRVSKAQAERNRAEIERVSAQMVLEHGLAVSLADVMAAAGLTHGGFYKHFRSKDEMAAAACCIAFDNAMDKWQTIARQSDSPAVARAELVSHYLFPSVDEEDAGCPMVCLAVDVSRSALDNPVRPSFNQGFEKLVAIFSDLQTAGAENQTQREQALLNISKMVGAMILARATQGESVADELLAASYKALVPADLAADIKSDVNADKSRVIER